MKLPNFKRIYKSDFPKEFEQFIETLGFILNTAIEQIYQGFNKNITITENIKCSVKDVLITVDANGNPASATKMDLDIIGKISVVVVGKADNLTNSAVYPSSGVFISWIQSGKTIIINNVTGLQPNNNYRLKVVAFGE